MAGHPPSEITPRRELNQKLLGRQARSETNDAVFESNPVATSTADMVWNQVTASQFTPRHEDALSASRGKDEASPSLVSSPSGGGPDPRQQRPPGCAAPAPAPPAPPPPEGAPPPPTGGVQGEGAAEELTATVNELRETMEKERERSRQLEKRAAEAEFIAVWLKEELDKTQTAADLDGTRPAVRGGPEDGADAAQRTRGGDFSFCSPGSPEAEDLEMDSTRPVQRRAPGGAAASQAVGTSGAAGQVPTRPQLGSSAITQPKLGSSLITQPKLGLGLQPDSSAVQRSLADGLEVQRLPSFDDEAVDVSKIEDPRQLREELLRSHRYIEEKQQEVISLEEQNLVLREELNLEKQKVIDLKRAANAQQEASQKASGDLEMSRWLQEEVALLRNETVRLQEQLEQAGQREQLMKAELVDLRSAAGNLNDQHSEEMGRLSMTVGLQLVNVERELAQRTQELSEATEPFLKHAHGLLSAARKACVQIEGASGRPRQAPPLYDLRSRDRDLAGSFRCILKLLKYMVEVLAQHTGMVNPFERGGDACSVAETAASLASSALDFSQQGSHYQTLRAPTDVSQQGSPYQTLRAAEQDLPQQGGSQRRSLQAPTEAASLRSLGPGAGQAADGAEDAGPTVLRDDRASKRWMCYMQE